MPNPRQQTGKRKELSMSTLLKQQAYQLHFYGSGYRILLFSVLASTALVLPTKVDAADVTDVFLGPGAGPSATNGKDDTGVGYPALNQNNTGSHTTAPPGGFLRSNTMPPAPTTRLPVFPRSSSTAPATKIPPPVPMPWKPTAVAAITLLTALMRSSPIRPGRRTQPAGFRRSSPTA